MNSDVVWMIVRYGLLAGFSWLASKGVIQESQTEGLIGAIGSIFTVLWGVFVKTGTKSVSAEMAKQADLPTISQGSGSVKP